jgi:predicted RNA-binding Zn-ribbon protein involved in translation (DUF1610 family)
MISGASVNADLLQAIRAFPVRREIEHCGARIAIDPFEFHADCPHCGSRIKVRSFAATPEIEDVFDAVFEWMSQEGASAVAKHRQVALAAGE